MSKFSTLMLAGLLSAVASPVLAQVATMDANSDIFVSGLGSYQQVEVTYEGVPKTSRKTSNECGYIRLASSTSTPLNPATDSISFNGTTYNLATVPLSGSLRCANGVLEGAVAGTVQKDADDRVYITGLSPFTDYQVEFNSIFTTRKVKANTCGIAKISNTDRFDNTSGAMSLKDADTEAVIGALPTTMPTTGGPVCRRGVGFYPTGYPTTPNVN